MKHLLLTIVFVCFAAGVSLADNAVITQKMNRVLETASPEEPVSAWIYFTDKGTSLSKALATAEANLTEKALQRRLRNRPADQLVDRYDVPVNPEYAQILRQNGVEIQHKSRWLNAVSATAKPAILNSLTSLQFIKKIDVIRYTKVPQLAEAEIQPELQKSTKTTLLDYGSSLDQNVQITTNAMHDLGYSGAGVTVAMLDAGYNNLEHEALQHLNITHTWDFVNGDENVDDEAGQMGTGSHGTYTLSTLAGYKPGNLIGPAYGATFLLAKTENTDWEHNVEEDDWVAAAEWADSLGADIISSSLGYWDFDFGEPRQYSWEDMNGNTAVVTIGADIAASRGILVVNSAGNSGDIAEPANTLGAPSDGDSVLAIGAVSSTGALAGFSSRGPSADGRIKPDVCARGVSTVCASAFSATGYAAVNGTSLSCPLVAGAAALVLEANPGLSNMEIIDALRSTADNAATPDRDFGWGIIDTYAASNFLSGIGNNTNLPEKIELYPAFPNPFNPATTINYALPEAANIELSVFNLLGQRVAVLFKGQQLAGEYRQRWDAGNQPAGVYFIVLESGKARQVQKAVLLK